MKRSAEESEARISRWRPARSYELPEGLVSAGPAELVGTWRDGMRMDPSTFVFKESGGGQFNLEFYGGGCLDMWEYSRTATLSKGVLKLSRAVETYRHDMFDKLFFVRKDGRLVLIPAGAIERAKEDDPKKDEFEFWVDRYTFRKQQEK